MFIFSFCHFRYGFYQREDMGSRKYLTLSLSRGSRSTQLSLQSRGVRQRKYSVRNRKQIGRSSISLLTVRVLMKGLMVDDVVQAISLTNFLHFLRLDTKPTSGILYLLDQGDNPHSMIIDSELYSCHLTSEQLMNHEVQCYCSIHGFYHTKETNMVQTNQSASKPICLSNIIF